MPKFIHPTAKISKNVIIEDDAFIGENVEIGEETIIGKGCYIDKNTKIGKRNKIFPYAVIGTPPQHIAYKDEETYTEIGDENIIREFTTIHRGTIQGGGITKIGSRNYLMAYSHVGHDSIIKSDCIITSFSALAGHTVVDDKVVFGGFSGTHQFVRVGKLAMIGAGSFPTKDVPPFVLITGVDARIAGLNIVGLRRAGIPSHEIEKLKKALKIYLDISLKIEEVEQEIKKIDSNSDLIKYFCDFIRTPSKRGLIRKSKKSQDSQEDR